MNFASIDVGTNAVLLLVVKKNGRLEELFDTSTITRLGEGLIGQGYLSDPAMERTITALQNYRIIMDSYSATPVVCFGTSALREAGNRDAFIKMARERAGIDLKVFSEYQEAYYTYLSVRDDSRIAGEKLVIVDIGGGSTEIIEGSRDSFEAYVSLPVGTVKLTELFVTHDPPLAEELMQLSRFVRGKVPVGEGEGARTMVGVGGTMTTLAAIVLGLKEFDKNRIHGLTIPDAALEDCIERLSRMSVAERRHVPGMEPGREDLLLQGIILMREIVSAFGAKGVTVSTYGARYGVLYEMLEGKKPISDTSRT